MPFLAVVVLVFWVASGWRLSWVSLGTLVGGWCARNFDIIGHIVPCNTHTHTCSSNTFRFYLSIIHILQILPIPLLTSLSFSFLSAMHTFIFSPHSLCAMYFFLLACSLWGALLLFRRSRYKGHAKYKSKSKSIINHQYHIIKDAAHKQRNVRSRITVSPVRPEKPLKSRFGELKCSLESYAFARPLVVVFFPASLHFSAWMRERERTREKTNG